MIKIVLHSLPNEIDQVAWIVDQLVRSSRFINPKGFILDFTLNVSNEDTDLIFPEIILYYLYESINQIEEEYYLITPQIFQLWDVSWDIISHPSYRNIPREKKQWLKNPYQVKLHLLFCASIYLQAKK